MTKVMRAAEGLVARRRAEILIREEEEAKSAMRPKSKPKQHQRVGKASSVSTATKTSSGQGVADEPESEHEHEDIDQMLITSTFGRRSVALQQGRAAKGRKDKQTSACSHPPTAQRNPQAQGHPWGPPLVTLSAASPVSSSYDSCVLAPAHRTPGHVKGGGLPPLVEPIGVPRTGLLNASVDEKPSSTKGASGSQRRSQSSDATSNKSRRCITKPSSSAAAAPPSPVPPSAEGIASTSQLFSPATPSPPLSSPLPATDSAVKGTCVGCYGEHGAASIKLMPCKHIPYCVRCFGDMKRAHEQSVAGVKRQNARREQGEPQKDLPVFACPCCHSGIVFACTREEVLRWVRDDYTLHE
ncbi:unnamed protein product [Vitrella brassicaformis CCMP3155]|uniref:Uncharacterized protein n=1 Tax=Vitrella brassicaformis (strain CCMP3155) TaxID=1169540 RepID=A0A0G4G7L3_VITBC|nr:unnamed protein product [Vitrella brassicaformis CCMP3155]|eukprot:CEM24394.1 unnamed protein product [Vitrella brassicaformis CCMP3155]